MARLIALSLAAALLAGQQDLEIRFTASMHTEMVEGDLNRALGQFQALLPLAKSNHPLAARTLLEIGRCQEKLGQREAARLTYMRLLRDYPDQSKAAKEKLAALAASPRAPNNLNFARGQSGWMPESGRFSQTFSAVPYRGKTVRLQAQSGARLRLTVDHKIMDEGQREIAGLIDPEAENIEIATTSISPLTFEIVPESELTSIRTAIQKSYAPLDAAAGDLAHRTTIMALQLTGAGAVVTTHSEYVRSESNRSTSYVATRRDTWERAGAQWNFKDSRILATRQVESTTDAQTARRAAEDLKHTAAPIATLETGHTFYDLAPFGAAVNDSRIVALGEATWGTREVFQIKHRLLEYLVKEKGFSVLAINANYPEAVALDLYVKSGEGDPRVVLTGMLWPWNTREALDIVEWMRQYNDAPATHRRLSFASFGIAPASVVAPRVVEYLKQCSPLDAITAQTSYAALLDIESRLGDLYDDAAAKAAGNARAVIKLLEDKRDHLIQASSAEAWRDARQQAEMARQAAMARTAGKTSAFASEMMARNVEWLANDAHPGEKIVIWGDNSLVEYTAAEPGKTLTAWLRDEFAEHVYVAGLAIHRGELLAMGVRNGQNTGLARQIIPDPVEPNGDSVLSAAGMPVFFLDFRSGDPVSALGRWLLEPHSFLDAGLLWNQDDPQSNWRPKVISKAYDGVVFLEEAHTAKML